MAEDLVVGSLCRDASVEYNFVEDIVVDPKSVPEDIVVDTTSNSTGNSE